MHGHFGAVILRGLHAGDLAVLDDQLVGGGAEHDLVGLVRGRHRVIRHGEVSAPLAGVFHAVHHAADRRVLALPQAADEGGLLAVIEDRTLSDEPRLDVLTALDELAHQVVTAVNPRAVVSVRAQAAVIGLEDVQVDGGEQGQLGLFHARIELRLRPVEIRLNLFLQGLQGREVFLMHTSDGVQGDIARDERMLVVQRAVERLFRPTEDGLERVDAARVVLHLVIGLAIQRVHAGGRVRISRVPDEVRHHRLESAAGNERVAAHLGVLFKHDDGAAVLRGLGRRNHARAARADNDHVIGLFNRGLSGVLDGVRLKGAEVGAPGLLRRVVHGVAQRGAGEGCAGNAVHTGAIRRQHVRNHRLKGHVADVRRLAGIGHFDGGHRVVGEGHAHGHIAVVALRGSGIRARLERDGRVVGGRLALGLRQRGGKRFLNSGAGHGRARGHIHAVRVGHADQRGVVTLDGRAAERRGFALARHFNRGHGIRIDRHLHGHGAAEALGGSLILTGGEAGRAARRQRQGRKHHGSRKGNHLFVHVFSPFIVERPQGPSLLTDDMIGGKAA